MSDIVDSILHDIGSALPSNPSENSSNASVFTDEDIDNIIEENMQTENNPLEERMNSFIEEAVEYAVQNSSALASASEENTDIDDLSSEESESTDNDSAESTSAAEAEDIPLNSPSLLVDESTTRFSGTEWYNEIQKQRVIIAGIGGIGSNAAYQIARMVPANITLYDSDIVERVNMAGQMFSRSDIGKSKVDAMAERISLYTAAPNVNAIRDLFTPETEPGNIMICGFDNMTARKDFFNSWCKHLASVHEEDESKCLYIDGRMSIDTLQVFCIRGDDKYNKHRYKKEFLFDDSEAEATVCSMKQTTYLACMIGSIITNLFVNFVANSLNPILPYDLPFFTEYDAHNMIFKTES